MTYLLCPFTGPTDFARMAELSRRDRHTHLHTIDLSYRFSSWAFDNPANAALWLDEKGELAAWAVLQTPFWTFDLAFGPTASFALRSDVLAWADDRAHQVSETPYGRPRWFVPVFAGDRDTRRALESAGFADQHEAGEDSWSKVWMQRPAGLNVPAFRLPQGFTIRSLAGEAEAAEYVELHQVTFGSKNMTVEWRRRTLLQPGYRPDLDVVVEAPNGRLGAFCIGWLDASGPAPLGQIEPLGCHPDFRRYALGRLALAEVLRRLQAAGAHHIFVETDNYRSTALALYESLGFTDKQEVRIYRKDNVL